MLARRLLWLQSTHAINCEMKDGATFFLDGVVDIQVIFRLVSTLGEVCFLGDKFTC